MEPKRIIKLTWTTVSIFFLAALNSSRVLDNSSRNLELSIWDCSHNCKIKGKKVIKAQNPTSTHCSKSSFFVQKFNFDFPKKLLIFLGEKLVKMLWLSTVKLLTTLISREKLSRKFCVKNS